MAFEFLKTLRDAGKITDEELTEGQGEFEKATSGMRKFEKRVKELEKELDETETILGTVLEKAGVDPEDDDVIEKLEAALSTKQDSKPDPKMKELEKMVKTLMTERDDALKREQQTARANAIGTIVSKFEGLTKAGKALLEARLSADYSDDFDIDVFKETFSTEYPDAYASHGTGGSGTQRPGGSGSSKKFSEMTLTERAELFKTNPAEYKRLETLNKG